MEKIHSKQEIMKELEIAMKYFLVHGRGVNYGNPMKSIPRRELEDADIIEIEDYKGHNIKIIIK
jgi:hypothetical protein